MVSQLIRWQTGGKYSHAAVQLDDGSIVESWQGDGVRPKVLPDYLGVDAFDVIGLTDKHKVIVVTWLRDQIGKRYDWWGVVRFLSRKRLPRKNDAWFCSELVYEAFSQAGIELLARTVSWEVSPEMLGRSPRLIEGKLFNFLISPPHFLTSPTSLKTE